MKVKQFVVALMVIVVASISIPQNLVAQTTSWTCVKALPKGAELIVERKGGEKVIGHLQAATDGTIAVTSDAGAFILARNNVEKIFYAVPRDGIKSRNRGALYGMLLGLAAGVAVSTVKHPESEAMPGVGAFFAGGRIGIWAGNIHARGKGKGSLIYSAK